MIKWAQYSAKPGKLYREYTSRYYYTKYPKNSSSIHRFSGLEPVALQNIKLILFKKIIFKENAHQVYIF